MLKQVIVTLVIAVGLMVGAHANEATEKPIFAEAVKRDPDGLATALKVTKAMEDGKELPIVEDGQIIMSRLAISLHGWAVTKGYLNDEAAKDYKVFQAAFVERHGEKFPVDQVKGMKLVVPAKVARQKDAPTTVAAAPAAPTVPAASAPVVSTPVVVTEAPAAKPVLPSNVVTEEKLNAAIKQQEQSMVASLDSQAKIMAGIIARQASHEETAKKKADFYKKAIAQIPDAKEREAVKAEIAKVEALRGQVHGLNERQNNFDGQMVKVNERLGNFQWFGYGIITILALLIAAALLLYRRITTVREEAIGEAVEAAEAGAEATLTAAQAAIKAGEARAAETVRTVKASAALALEEAEHAKADVAALAKRVGNIEAAVDLKEFSFEDDEVIALVHALSIGGTTVFEFTVDGNPYTLHFERVDAFTVKVHGIKDQRNAVKIENLPARIKRAANKGSLVGITPVTDAIALPMRRSA